MTPQRDATSTFNLPLANGCDPPIMFNAERKEKKRKEKCSFEC